MRSNSDGGQRSAERISPLGGAALGENRRGADAASCAAPLAPLMEGFDAVAVAPPAEKAALLQRVIDEDRPRMPLALVSVAVLVAGMILFVSNARRLRGAGRSAAPPARRSVG